MTDSTTKSAERRNALAFGFASPIVGLTSALLFGMAASDLFGTLQVWVGVVIIALIGISLVVGAHFSAIAVNDTVGNKGAPRAAAVLNLVVVSIWSYVTLGMSIAGGISAVMALQEWDQNVSRTTIRGFNSDDIFNHFLPAQVMFLSLLGVLYFFVVLRSKGRKA
jgi:hypothetical protein